jgi:protein phosphatase
MQLSDALFETGSGTHAGKVRQHNEDRYLVLPDFGLWAVADGMGGHDSGDYASQTIVDALGTIGPPSSAAELLARTEQQIAAANTRLREVGRDRGDRVIGATLAVLLSFDRHYACVWSGDSRIYVVRGGAITQLSRDHTEVQELLAEGAITEAEARRWPRSNVVTRAIGVFDSPQLELTSGPLRDGDCFVICSDGLTQHVSDDEILRCVLDNAAQPACDALIALTLERGATDNVTVVVARYRARPAPTAAAADLWE